MSAIRHAKALPVKISILCWDVSVMRDQSPLLVFSDDWGRHPSSCQHLVRQLLPRRPVCWVNTVGTRAPRLDWMTVSRGFGKLRQWCGNRSRTTAILPANLRVLNPKMWPWFRSPFDRWVNCKLLLRQLTKAVAELPAPPVAVTTIPIVADLVGALPVKRWVYYCVDDFSQWPGLDQATMAGMERKLLDRVDSVIAVSENLQDRLARLGRSSSLLTHGVDLDFWSTTPELVIPGLDSVPGPLAVFFGVIDRRLDLEFLARLDATMTAGTILLVGPQADPDPALRSMKRVLLWPALAYEQLPTLARAASVLIMPYGDMPVTRAMQPLKLKEYLASGKPAVVRDLPANRVWDSCLDLAADPDSFARLVQMRLSTGLIPEQQTARRRLQEETWSEKARVFEECLNRQETMAAAG